MDKKTLLNELFYIAYHSGDLPANVKKFLRENFPTMQDNKHVSSMKHFCNVLALRNEPNPFILGMLCDAWRQFLTEVS